jgi:hypothetical protein
VATWRGVDDAGRAVASGTYFCRIECGGAGTIGSLSLVR